MQVIGQQGEVKIFKAAHLPDGLVPGTVEKTARGAWIISHSEKGHHHVIAGDVDVMEQVKDVPPGLRILWAIVREPTALAQEASDPHGKIVLDPGIYQLRRAREYNPFAEQVRAVQD